MWKKTNLMCVSSVVNDLYPVSAWGIDVVVEQAVVIFVASSAGSGCGVVVPDKERCDRLSQISGPVLEEAREAVELVNSGGNVSSLSGFLRVIVCKREWQILAVLADGSVTEWQYGSD